MSKTGDKVAEGLRSLGGTPEAIACQLYAMDIEGERMKPRSCPVANFLKTVGWKSVVVGPNTITVRKPWSLHFVHIPVNEAVKDFTVRFDIKDFPGLISNAA